MIAIVNLSKTNGPGIAQYEVSIFDGTECRKIVCFKHRRADGLAKCLYLAAEAVDKELTHQMNELTQRVIENRGDPADTAVMGVAEVS